MPRVLTAVVLAGGQSSRLGKDKAAAPVGGRPLLRRVLEVLREITHDIVVVEAPERPRPWLEREGVRRASDAVPGGGPLYGLHAGLLASYSEHAWVVGCDMPFLHTGLLRYLAGCVGCCDAVAPRWEGVPQPLCAVYSVGCLARTARLLPEGGSPRRLLESVTTRWVSQWEAEALGAGPEAFSSVNTPEELHTAQRLAGASESERSDRDG